MNLSTEFDVTNWSFTAGPQHLSETMASVDVFEVQEHPISAIAETLLCFPQTELFHPAEPSWHEWRDGEHYLELD